jgi:predicted nucleic acid-binding protein
MVKRLWLDADVVLRYLVQDPPELGERALRLMDRAERGEIRLYLTRLTLAEVFWVLKSFYRQPVERIVDTLVALVAAPGIEVDARARVTQALELTRDRNVSLPDALLAVEAAHAGETVVTFDKTDFKKLPALWLSPD